MKTGFKVVKNHTKEDEQLEVLSIECFGISKIAEVRDPLRIDYLEYIMDY